jgi:hypothetical protein
MANISASAGTKIYVGPQVALSAITSLDEAAALAAFEAIVENDWVEIGGVESLGEFGDQSNPITFASLGDTRMLKLKGVRDAGTMAVVVGRDPEDEGQLAMEAAEKTPSNYRFRVVLNDEPTDDYSPSTFYFAAQVQSRAVNVADVNAVTRRTYNVGINTQVYEDPADPTGS